jgi:hypothetical protein
MLPQGRAGAMRGLAQGGLELMNAVAQFANTTPSGPMN